jgi:hypothetical protein
MRVGDTVSDTDAIVVGDSDGDTISFRHANRDTLAFEHAYSYSVAFSDANIIRHAVVYHVTDGDANHVGNTLADWIRHCNSHTDAFWHRLSQRDTVDFTDAEQQQFIIWYYQRVHICNCDKNTHANRDTIIVAVRCDCARHPP